VDVLLLARRDRGDIGESQDGSPLFRVGDPARTALAVIEFEGTVVALPNPGVALNETKEGMRLTVPLDVMRKPT
jgi:hypothetical protein